MNGELVITDDVPGAFAAAVADSYRARADDSFSLALSGGELARSCYERLADLPGDPIDWWNVDVYWGDERCVPPDDPDSNQLLGRQALLERVGAANSVHPMRCEEGPNAYQLKIGELGMFDLVHLGLGPDGHTASLFPGSPGLSAPPGQLVCLNSDPSGRNPHDRMTLTFEGLARARLIIFTVSGAKKADALARVYRGEDLPAGRVSAEKIIWLVDPEASPL
ncbi:MAG: 6-phosphogluconolactonase [Acidimicrobiales bacterium]